ncbi:unnamed protein product [Cuscuta europaea]|uniref:Uncharacterized protein n=1 Tax=Cuscuta europaea TaxID=41803 RepID=A0A9P0ZIA5_CUSEU|nr:unnamed protein product [Cuscuta europaea]
MPSKWHSYPSKKFVFPFENAIKMAFSTHVGILKKMMTTVAAAARDEVAVAGSTLVEPGSESSAIGFAEPGVGG